MKGKEMKETRSWFKEHIRGLHLNASFVRGLFGPASTNIFSRISGTHEYF